MYFYEFHGMELHNEGFQGMRILKFQESSGISTCFSRSYDFYDYQVGRKTIKFEGFVTSVVYSFPFHKIIYKDLIKER